MVYRSSRMAVVLREGYTLLTKLKSPTYRLPSPSHARATGASSLLPSARPPQLGQEMLRRLPFPMMLLMTGGCCLDMKTFSPEPLWRIPGGRN